VGCRRASLVVSQADSFSPCPSQLLLRLRYRQRLRLGVRLVRLVLRLLRLSGGRGVLGLVVAALLALVRGGVVSGPGGVIPRLLLAVLLVLARSRWCMCRWCFQWRLASLAAESRLLSFLFALGWVSGVVAATLLALVRGGDVSGPGVGSQSLVAVDLVRLLARSCWSMRISQ
jgi:hypothetical protein